MRILGGVASGVLILEFGLSAIAGIPAMQVAVNRFTSLTRTPPRRDVIVLIGLLDLLGVVGVIQGFWQTAPAVAAGSFFALLSGFVVYRQVTHGDTGKELVPYTLFLACALIMIISRVQSS
ncbi:DoxX family protein [Kitasatospora sp. GAS204B]|uniref:DoxX family protein n=1 Tax=unclassified Kitasatospora TaxID=2633591 RepID=UPI0024730031|nr:DoxX family protein [Kitasatospora sp. GAS204B]MDH6120769.1 hypothetical protein [Kitasatospora sp. GAS204B]